jgi:hypothetical protein
MLGPTGLIFWLRLGTDLAAIHLAGKMRGVDIRRPTQPMALKFPTVTTLVLVCFCALSKNRGEFAAGHKLAVLMGVELQTQLSGRF